MNILEYTYSLLKKLKNKEVTFSNLMNKQISSEEIDSVYVVPVKDSLKAIVNRYYFLSWEIKHYLKGVALDEDSLDYLIVCLAFLRYARNIDQIDLLGMLNSSISSKNLDLDLIDKMMIDLKKDVTSLPDCFNENFSKKISLNYSYPEWLVSMIRKHFGTRNAYKSISSSRKSTPLSLCANELLIEELNNDSFLKTPTTDYSYFYVGKKKLYEEELFIKHKVFLLDQSEQKILEELRFLQGEKVLLLGDFDPNFVSGVCIKICDLGKVRAACSTYPLTLDMKKSTSRFHFKSLEVFESTLPLLCTHVVNDNDRVIVYPENSELGLVRKKPEVLLSLKREDFDYYLEKQLEILNEACKYVKNDGELDYIVPTINKKETFVLIREFLKQHSEFGMIDENMIFPFDYKGEGIYYARIRRLGK